jgi:hypothetical protein
MAQRRFYDTGIQRKYKEKRKKEETFIPFAGKTPQQIERLKEAASKGGAFEELKKIKKEKEGLPVEEKKPIKQPELSTIEKVAKVGLLPAAAGAKLLSKTDLSIGEIAEQTARTGAGKALGVGTVAAATVLTGVAASKLLVGGTMAAKSGTAVITSTKTTIGSGYVGKEFVAKGTSITMQRAFQTLGGSKIAMFQKSIGKMSVPAVKKLLTSKGFIKIGAGIAGTDAIMAWLASDNIMSGISIHMRDLQFAVKNGAVSKEDALAEIQSQQEWKDYAEGFVKISSKVNPILWPFGKLLLINAKKTQIDIDLQTQNIIMAGLT